MIALTGTKGAAEDWVISELGENSGQIELVGKFALQLTEPSVEGSAAIGVRRVGGKIAHLVRVGGQVVKPGDLGCRIHDQLPAVVDHGTLQIEIGPINGTVRRLRLLAFQ